MLTDDQRETAERLIVQMNKIANAIEQLNDVGREINMPPCSIRFQPSKLINGENPYLSHINNLISMDCMERIELLIYTKD